MYAHTSGMHAADISIVTPPAYHPEYVPLLLDICDRYDIKLLCSLHDLDVYMLSQQQDSFYKKGVFTTLPSPEWGRITLDKWECIQTLAAENIDVPWTAISLESVVDAIMSGEICYPLVVKARVGFGSLGLIHCSNESELTEAIQNAKQSMVDVGISNYIKFPDNELVLIQEKVIGKEICITVFNDFSGSYLSHFTCEVLAMRAGESDCAKSIDREPFKEISQRLSRICSHIANWGFDCLQYESGLKLIDINPRFSGDYPFHHLAGANVPRALLELIRGQSVDPINLIHNPGVTMFKDIVPKISPPDHININA
jgi:carbamoyl-phosphate synthase large subunit